MGLVVTGTISIDTIHTPDGESREEILGGSAAYFAAAASLFGPVSLVGAVGEDFPAGLREMIAKFPQIDTAGVETRAGSKSFRWGGKYKENMDQRETLFTTLGVLEEAAPPVPDAYKDAEYVFLANSHPAVQMGFLSNFSNRKLAVADTMDLWIDLARDDLKALLGKVDGLVLNHEEAEQYTGKRNAITAGRLMLEDGPTFVVIKKGEHGAVLVHREGLAALPAYPAEKVVDPTGAGDSFAGGMMAHLAQTGDLSPTGILAAMARGTVVASYNIESFTLDRLASITPADVQARYDEFAAMTRI